MAQSYLTAEAQPAQAPALVFQRNTLDMGRFGADGSLVQEWRRLEADAFLPTQSHAFACSLSRTMLAGQTVNVFYVNHSDTVAALLPLCRDRSYFSRWRLIGAAEVFEPGDVLCDSPEAAEQMAQAIVADGRPLRLDRVPAHSPLIPALKAAMKRRGFMSVRPAVPCPTIALDEAWKQPETCFNAGRRSDFRRAAKKAEAFGRTSFEVLSPDPIQFDQLFDEAVAVELESWKKEAGSAIASDGRKESFFRDFFRSACEAGKFRIAFMRIDGQPVAMQMAVACRRRFSLFKIGYDEKFSKCSPGNLLMLYTLGWAATQDHMAYEMLGNIEPWIAQLWTRKQHDCQQLRTYPLNLRGAAAFVADAAAWLRGKVLRRFA